MEGGTKLSFILSLILLEKKKSDVHHTSRGSVSLNTCLKGTSSNLLKYCILTTQTNNIQMRINSSKFIFYNIPPKLTYSHNDQQTHLQLGQFQIPLIDLIKERNTRGGD